MLQGNTEASFGGESTVTSILGVTPDYAIVRNYAVTEGEFINEGYLLGRSSVVLLKPEVVEGLFGRIEAIEGETVRIEGQPFRVIGILESKGGGLGPKQDDRIIVPLTTAQTRLLRRGGEIEGGYLSW